MTGPGGTNTVTKTGLINVRPGAPARITVSPESVAVAVQSTAAFVAEIEDAYGNAATASVEWRVIGGGGSIDASGAFTAGTAARPFPNTIRVRQPRVPSLASSPSSCN